MDIWLQDDAKESSYSLAFKNEICEHLILKMDRHVLPNARSLGPGGFRHLPILWAGVHTWTNMEERTGRLD